MASKERSVRLLRSLEKIKARASEMKAAKLLKHERRLSLNLERLQNLEDLKEIEFE